MARSAEAPEVGVGFVQLLFERKRKACALKANRNPLKDNRIKAREGVVTGSRIVRPAGRTQAADPICYVVHPPFYVIDTRVKGLQRKAAVRASVIVPPLEYGVTDAERATKNGCGIQDEQYEPQRNTNCHRSPLYLRRCLFSGDYTSTAESA